MNGGRESLLLYHTPGTSSRIVLNALEEVGVPFEDHPVDIFTDAQRSPDFLAVNPKGKVPALVIAGATLTETPAILTWLSERAPAGALMPGPDALSRAHAVGDLVWCSNTLHPLVRMIRMPQRATDGDPEAVRRRAIEEMRPMLDMMRDRLAAAPWWWGEHWSIVDVYLGWITGMCVGCGLELADHAALLDHEQRVRARPSFRRALMREQRALDASGIRLPGGRL